MRTIEVVDYDPRWPGLFDQLRSQVWSVVGDIALGVEHVGSTSVPGLAAKPIIDLTVVVRSPDDVPLAIRRLATLGYVHRGDLGIRGREAFHSPEGLPAHHLYLCPQDSLGLRNPLAVRDYLRTHPEAVGEYGELKKALAAGFPHDIDGYLEGKTAFIIGILRQSGFDQSELDAIAAANRKP